MTADVIAWLRSDEGEEWSRARSADGMTTAAPHMYDPHGDRNPGEDPCGRPPVTAEATG